MKYAMGRREGGNEVCKGKKGGREGGKYKCAMGRRAESEVYIGRERERGESEVCKRREGVIMKYAMHSCCLTPFLVSVLGDWPNPGDDWELDIKPPPPP